MVYAEATIMVMCSRLLGWLVRREIAGVAEAIICLFQDNHHHRLTMVVVEVACPDERPPESLKFWTSYLTSIMEVD